MKLVKIDKSHSIDPSKVVQMKKDSWGINPGPYGYERTRYFTTIKMNDGTEFDSWHDSEEARNESYEMIVELS